MNTKKRIFRAAAISVAMFVPALVVAQVIEFEDGDTLTASSLNRLRTTAARVMTNSNTPNDGGNRVSSSFSTRGGPLLITVSATAFRETAGQLRIDILLFGGSTIPIIGNLIGFANEVNSHKALPPITMVTTQPAGTYTVQLRNSAGTLTDANDFANVTVLEIAQ